MNTDGNINNILNGQNVKNIGLSQNQNGKKIDSQNNGKSFEEVLKETARANSLIASEIKLRQYALNTGPAEQQLTFSKHAKQRLVQRNIEIDSELIEKINEAVKKASEKSIKNALVLADESAFIVNVGSSVVVTAMNSLEMRASVITNIDGTVIL
jgi:flagellar operon protein